MAGNLMTNVSNAFLLKQEKRRAEFVWKGLSTYQMILKRGQKGTLAGRSGQSQWSNKEYGADSSSAHSEAGAFSTASTSKHALSTVSGVRLNFSGELTGDVEAFGRRGEWRYMLEPIKECTEDIFSAMRFYAATNFWMNGDNLLGQVNGTPSGTTNGTFVLDEAQKVNLIRKGMTLTSREATTSGTEQFTNGTNLVVDVDRTTNTVTMADLTGLADDDYIYKAGHYDQTAPNGVRNLILGTGTVNNINRATAGNTYYKAFILDRGGSPLTEANTRTIGLQIAHLAASDPDDIKFVILHDLDGAQVLWNLVSDSWRFSDKGMAEIGFGDTKVHTPFGTAVTIADPMCHQSDMYWTTPSDWVFYAPPGEGGSLQDLGEWYETGGQRIHPKRSSDALADAKQMVRTWRYQLTVRHPDRHGKITDFT